MTNQEVEQIEKCANLIYNKVMTRLGYEDEQDIGEAVAIRLIDGLEWSAPSYSIAVLAASRIVNDFPLPKGASGYIKKHFDLAY